MNGIFFLDLSKFVVMSFSTSEENYIKEIYHLQMLHGKVSTNHLSAAMNTKPASVTDMLKKLQVKKIVNYKPYREFDLTEDGNRAALNLIRKHRLWEYFLVHTLGFSWELVHDVAEQLEHIKSKELVDKLDSFLGHPDFDPHGDPIPDDHGRMKKRKQTSLRNLPLKKTLTVSAIKNQSPEMLSLLDHYSIGIGTKLRVSRFFDFDDSVEVKIGNKAPVILSSRIADHIYCLYE